MPAETRHLPGSGPGSLSGLALIAATAAVAPLGRHRYNHWGATPEEVAARLPGDELVPRPRMSSTRAVSVATGPERVWPWIAQIGQGRAGFYSYDGLENAVGCGIHSATRIVAELQELRVGDLILLARRRAPCYRVAMVEPPSVLVLVGADPSTHELSSALTTGPASTWQWVLTGTADGGTRLVVRQRYWYAPAQSVMWHLVEPVAFVMERRMLLNVKRLAETTDSADNGQGGAARPTGTGRTIESRPAEGRQLL